MHFDHELDVRGLTCPLPIIKSKNALGKLTSGQVLRVLATDIGAPKDFEVFARQSGNELLAQNNNSDFFEFYLKRR